jgi:Tol biopolymer transport system component
VYTLHTVPATGGTSKHLVGDESFQASRPDWSWSPATIAFTGQQGDVVTTWLIESDGKNLRQLPNSGGLTNTFYPSWSQNLRSIVGMDGGGDNHVVLYKFSVDGSLAPVALTKYSEVCAGRPSIAPSGSQVAFAGTKGAYNQQNNQIWTVTSPCLGICQLNPLQGRSPNWSPDGQWILFESNRDNPNYQLFVMPSDGSGEPVALTDPKLFVQHGEWSRQQDKIVFAASGKGIGVIEAPAAFRW